MRTGLHPRRAVRASCTSDSLDGMKARPSNGGVERALQLLLQFIKQEKADVIDGAASLGERLFKQTDQIQNVDEHVGDESKQQSRGRIALRLQEEQEDDDRDDQRLHQYMYRWDEFDALDGVDAKQRPAYRILIGAEAHDKIRGHAHALQSTEDGGQLA